MNANVMLVDLNGDFSNEIAFIERRTKSLRST